MKNDIEMSGAPFKSRLVDSCTDARIDEVIIEEYYKDFEPISVGYGFGLPGDGCVILFKKIKK